MKTDKISTFALMTWIALGCCALPMVARAAEVESVDLPAQEDTSKEEDLGTGKFSAFPFHFSVSVRAGYDDNATLASATKQGSPFATTQLGVVYNFGNPRTTISLSAGAGITYYTDRGTTNLSAPGTSDDYDVNGSITFALTHRATPRLTLAISAYATYQSQPDFFAFKTGAIDYSRIDQDFFVMVDKFSVIYAWTPRFSTVSSYTLGYTDYSDELLSSYQDRFDHTLGNEFRFLVWPTTTLVAEYRFGIVDYTENEFRNSLTHFFLGGFDHNFNPRFNVSLRGGIEVRDYEDNAATLDQDTTAISPYAEGMLTYGYAQNSSISWTNRYSLEEPDIPGALTRTTFRTSLAVRQGFTARIAAGVNVGYQHDNNEASLAVASFQEDAFDLSIYARFTMNRTFAFDVGYEHTQLFSDAALNREYSRNRIYTGVTFTF